MKFFTRERYEAIQRAETEWDQAGDAYRQRLESISDGLPAGARALAGDILHDARIEKIEQPSSSELRMTVRRALGPTGSITVSFRGVAGSGLDAGRVGEDVLYDELDTAPAGFLYRALLTTGELFVEAADVAVEEVGAPDGDEDLTVTATHKCAGQPGGDAWAIVRIGTAARTHFWAPLSGPLEAGDMLRDSADLFDLGIAYCPRCGVKLEE